MHLGADGNGSRREGRYRGLEERDVLLAARDISLRRSVPFDGHIKSWPRKAFLTQNACLRLTVCTGLLLLGLAGFTHHFCQKGSSNLRGQLQLAESTPIRLADLDFCGQPEEDVEYHTHVSLATSGPVYSAEQCCAVCDGHPDCSAWTWAKESATGPGLSGMCHLRALSLGEKVVRTHRPGIVSGLLSHRLQKHGVMAAMLQQQHQQELEVSPNYSTTLQPTVAPDEMCRGQVDVAGYGNFSVVNALMSTPSQEAAPAVVEGRWAIVAPMNSRVYLADSCRADMQEVHSKYLHLKLLGRTLRYKVDVSGLGCGCDALVQLLPLRQNPWESLCHDYYCSASKICGVPCTEIQVQSANQYSWVTSIHTHDDVAGATGGYSGGTSWVGDRDWNGSHYGPGSECIDTSWPFEVAVSFPTASNGRLKYVKVQLSQGNCVVHAKLDQYTFRGRDGLAEISAVLKAGVTPVISYWKSNKMLWLDGPGLDGQGPCIQDAPQACPGSARIFGFAVEDYNPDQPRTQPETLISHALREIHKEQKHVAEAIRQEDLATAIATQDAMNDFKRDCTVDCTAKNGTVMGLNLTYDKETPPVAQLGSREEKRDNNIEWKVTEDRAPIQDKTGAPMGKWKIRDQVLIGKRQGEFVKLAFEDGYVSTNDLEERTVSYVLIASGNCSDHDLYPIHNPRTCEAAGFSLGYFDTEVEIYTGEKPRPEGCHVINGELAVTDSIANLGRGVHGLERPICSSMTYPRTTATTTTETTTTTSTTFTVTTATMGFPSLFCFYVVRVTGASGEMELVKAQVKEKVGIFLCDQYAVFTENVTVDFGRVPDGNEVKSITFEPAKVWLNQRQVRATVCVFVHVWEALKLDDRYRHMDWTIKVDPDTVLIPWRIRRHLGPHTGPARYLVTSTEREEHEKDDEVNALSSGVDSFSIDGAVEAYSKKALEDYLESGYKCMHALKWQQWTEEYYMEQCLQHLGVDYIRDVKILEDRKRKGFATCQNNETAAFHFFKDPRRWMKCWREAVH